LSEPGIDYKRKWYVMAAVAMGIFLATIDGSIVNVALPTLVRDLGADFPVVQWVVLAYLLTLATLLLSMGRLGDMLGKKPVYTIGFVVFTVGSALCGLAPTVQALIAFRVVQAIGGAMIMALGMAIVTEAFPPSERGKALGISGTVVSVGIIVGPTVGGLILGSLSWHWIFFVNIPVGIVGTLMVLRFVPSFKPSARPGFDYPGAISLFVGLLALLLALTFGQRLGFGDPRTLALFALSVGFLALFVAVERRSRQPMIDLRLFRNQFFSINLVTGLITFVSMGGTILLMPFFLENVLGYDTRQVGLLLAVSPLAIAVVAPLSGSLSDRFGTRPIAIVGLAAMFLGFYTMRTLDAQATALGYILRFLPVGVGMGIFQSPNNSAVMGAVPRERLGVASGLLSSTRTLGQTAGIAVIGAFWAGRVVFYDEAVPLEGVTGATAAAQVAALQDTFLVVMILLALGLALSAWGLVQERRLRRSAAMPVQASGE
jgi:EmrB/QacA subfamily drug resistance transporter